MLLHDSGNRIADLRAAFHMTQDAPESTSLFLARITEAFSVVDAQLAESFVVDGVSTRYLHVGTLLSMLFSGGLLQSRSRDMVLHDLQKPDSLSVFRDPQRVASLFIRAELNESCYNPSPAAPGASALKSAAPPSKPSRSERPIACSRCKFFGLPYAHSYSDCTYYESHPKFVGQAKLEAARARGEKLKAARVASRLAGAPAAPAAPAAAPPAPSAFPAFAGGLPADLSRDELSAIVTALQVLAARQPDSA